MNASSIVCPIRSARPKYDKCRIKPKHIIETIRLTIRVDKTFNEKIYERLTCSKLARKT